MLVLVIIVIVTLNRVVGIIILVKIPRGTRQNNSDVPPIRPVQIATLTIPIPNYQS